MNNQRRQITQRSVIQSPYGDLDLEQNELTVISADGGEVVTTTTTTSLEIDGEIIHDVRSQIIGRCQVENCNRYLTTRTCRCCGNPACRMIMCLEHAKYHKAEGLWFCIPCYKEVRIKRFFLTLLWLIVRPFVRKVY